MPRPISDYTPPTMRRIERGQDTEALYRAEDARNKAFREATEALQAVLQSYGVISTTQLQGQYYTQALPEALFSLLEGQDTAAALLACLAYVDWYRLNRTETYDAVLQHYINTRPIHAIYVQTEETVKQRAIACPACGLPPAEPEVIDENPEKHAFQPSPNFSDCCDLCGEPEAAHTGVLPK